MLYNIKIVHAVGLVCARPFEYDKLLARQSKGRRGQGIASCFVVRYLRGTTLVVNVALQEVTATILEAINIMD